MHKNLTKIFQNKKQIKIPKLDNIVFGNVYGNVSKNNQNFNPNIDHEDFAKIL